MKKFELMRNGDSVIRVLDIQQDRVLIIDCIKKTMPVWVQEDTIAAYSIVDELFVDTEPLDNEQKKVMRERFTLISPILPHIADNKARSQIIRSIADEQNISKQTVRNYLCEYLAYMDITALAPKKRSYDTELTQDEKNIRWALNKFFYTTQKQSLRTAYTMMLKEKYGQVLGKYVGSLKYEVKEDKKNKGSAEIHVSGVLKGVGSEFEADFKMYPDSEKDGYIWASLRGMTINGNQYSLNEAVYFWNCMFDAYDLGYDNLSDYLN